MTTDAKTDSYWADLPSDDFCVEAFKRFTPSASAMSSGGVGGVYQGLLLAARSAFYGAVPVDWTQGPSSAAVSAEGEEGNIITLKVNHLRTNALAQHQIVTAPPLAWQAQAVNTDSKSLASATRGSKILEYLWKNGNCDEKLIGAVLGAILFGEEFIFSPWSTMAGDLKGYNKETNQLHYKGDVVDHYVPSWDLLRDGTAKSYDASKWKCARLYVNRWDLIAEFPKERERILKMSAAITPNMTGLAAPLLQPWDSDRIPAYYFFHEQCPALPLGRQALLLASDLWLADDALEECYREVLPIHRMAVGDLKGTPYAYTSFWEAMGIQELSDDVQSSLATNIVAFGKQLIYGEAGVNYNVDSIGNGPSMMTGPKGTPPPEPMQLTAQPITAFEHLGELKQNSRETFGLNDISMGQPDTAQMNAQAFALLASMAVQQNSDPQKRYVKCATGMGRSRLRIFRAKASEPRKVAIVGKHGPLNSMQETFVGEDLSALNDVFVEIASPLSQTAAGRLQIAQLFIAQGFVQTPEQLESVVETGRRDPLTQGLQAELIYIAEENEGLLRGEPQAVKITDSHQMHVREHRATTFSAQARLDPKVNLATDAHIKEHLDFLLNTDPRILAAMGQAAPAMPMPPPGAPPGEGPPPALASPMDAQASPADVPPIQPPAPADGAPASAEFTPGGAQ